VAHAREPRVEGDGARPRAKTDPAHAALSTAEDFAVIGGVRKRERAPGLQGLRGPREHGPDLILGRGGLAAEQQDFDVTPLDAGEEPRRQNAGVVRDQEISRPEKRWQLVERVMPDRPRRPVERQEPGLIPRGGRMLRDPVPGEGVVEIGRPEAVLRLVRDRAS
jgi:hypothetical protein